jgi:putative protease
LVSLSIPTSQLHIPHHHPVLVLRPQLIKRLDAWLSGKLNVASAPTGFVMTTLMSVWVRHCGGMQNVLSSLASRIGICRVGLDVEFWSLITGIFHERAKCMIQYYWEDLYDQKEVAMETVIGHVTHYFNKINVAVLIIEDELKIGDTIHILGHTTDFAQKVTSMQIEHKNVNVVKPSDDFAIKVIAPVRDNDVVYKVIEETS